MGQLLIKMMMKWLFAINQIPNNMIMQIENMSDSEDSNQKEGQDHRNHFQVSESCGRECCSIFDLAINEIYCQEYL